VESTNRQITRLMESEDWKSVSEIMSTSHVSDIAEFLSKLGKPERLLVFRELSPTLLAEVFSYLEIHQQYELLESLNDKEVKNLLADMAPDDRIGLLEDLPSESAQRVIKLLSAEDLAESQSLLNYPESSAGRLMTPDYFTVKANWTVGYALETIRKKGHDRETVSTVYVTENRKLVGVVTLHQLVLDDPKTSVRDIMRSPAISVSALADQEAVADVMGRYDLSVTPVVNTEGALVGIITADDIFEASKEETTEDFQKGAAVSPLKTSVKTASPLRLYLNRIFWLLALMGVYLISGNIMSRFEHIISEAVPLVFFLPLLIDSAGNAGSQSATLMVRALGIGDVKLKDWAFVFFRELGLSLTMGLAMGLVVVGIGAVNSGIKIAMIVGISMVLNVVITCLIGVLIPFALERLKLDPASASSPLVTSVADIVGVLIYFSIASWFLRA
jgi:magnesium transporter